MAAQSRSWNFCPQTLLGFNHEIPRSPEIQPFRLQAVRIIRGDKFMLVSRELNAAYWALRIAFGLGPLLAGADKFTNILVNWEKYLSPRIQQYLPISATTFMHTAGVIEIIVGLVILFTGSRVFAYIAM